jgi:hypothetical protein
VGILGPLVLAAGALLGVWLGATYAARRLEVQLDEQAHWYGQRLVEETQRLEQQLLAESKRLERQLEHDHRMRDLDELRSMLDDVGAAMATAIELVAQAEALGAMAGLMEGPNAPDREAWKADRKKAQSDALAALQGGLLVQLQRLRFRFGDDHGVTRKFTEMRNTLMTNLLRKESADDQAEEDSRGVGRQYLEFVELCRPYVGVRDRV